MDQAKKDKLREVLVATGIKHEKIHIFGSNQCHIHVTCKELNESVSWALALAEIAQTNPAVARTSWPSYGVKNSLIDPVQIHGYLVAVTF